MRFAADDDRAPPGVRTDATMTLTGILSAGRAGVHVAVDSSDPEKLLGIRDGLVRFFEAGLHHPLPVRVESVAGSGDGTPMLLSDEEMIEKAQTRARSLRERFPDHAFSACSETGIHTVEVGERNLHFVKSWVVICAADGRRSEAVGGSGAVQLPVRLIEGLERGDLPFAVPGRRRRGGMTSSITGGIETRRRALSLATLNAVATLFFGVVETRPGNGGLYSQPG